jgi:hypothetical protein
LLGILSFERPKGAVRVDSVTYYRRCCGRVSFVPGKRMGFLNLRQLSRSASVLDLYLGRVRLDDVVDVMFCGLSSQITTHEA